MQVFGKLHTGKSLPECIESDLPLEQGGREHYLEAITYCEKVRDYVSRGILAGILLIPRDVLTTWKTSST